MDNLSTKEKILDSLKPIIKNSSVVSINKEKIFELAEKIKEYPIPNWDNITQFLGEPEETIQYYFFLDSINFCFWNIRGKERWTFEKDGEWLNGYSAFSYAIKKAVLKNKKLLDASYLSNITFEEFSKIFEGKGELLLLEKRHEIIRENFKILRDKYAENAANLVRIAENNVNKLIESILKDFPSFKDWSEFQDQKIYFLKRAQIFISDIYYAFQGKHYGFFKNMEDLTIFADYKLPQLLEAEGVLVYDETLKNKIKNDVLIEKDSLEEIEIRTNTIFACEMLVQQLSKLGRKLTSQNIDWMLWFLAKNTKFFLPYHKTITTNY